MKKLRWPHMLYIAYVIGAGGIQTKSMDRVAERLLARQADRFGWFWFAILKKKVRAPKEWEKKLQAHYDRGYRDPWVLYVDWSMESTVPKEIHEQLKGEEPV